MAMPAFPTAALSSLEAMLYSLMRGSGTGDDDDRLVDDTVASPPPPPLPARPTPRGRRRPSRSGVGPAVLPRTSLPSPSSPSPSPPKEQEDARADGDVSDLVEELERRAAEVEARLRQKEEENAALKRRMEGYHIRWLEYEIRIKSLEEAFHEQMAALQIAQDAARRARETACGGRGSPDAHAKVPEEPPVRLRHGRDRLLVGGRRGAAGRLGAELRRQSHTLVAEAPAAPGPGPWQPAAPSADSAEELKELKAQFRAWTKDYKARLRRASRAAEVDRDRRRGGGCWI